MIFLRKMIDPTVKLAGIVLKGRKIDVMDGQVKVNLGCGLALAPNWINVDASLNALFAGSWKWLINILYRISGSNRYYTSDEYLNILSDNKFVFHDLARSLPFKNNAVDFFYSSHFFEHLFRQDAQRLMSECYRSLKSGGVLRIAVPDLAYAVEQYREGKKVEMLENYFFVDDLSSYLARHKYMYDFELISNALRSAGFNKIVRCEYKVGSVPDIQALDNRPEETLFVEAFK